MAKRTQKNRAIGINTPLGEDVLLLKGFKLTEELGRPFMAQLELRSEDSKIDFNKIIGENVTIRVNRTDGKIRFINGFIARFAQEGFPQEGGSNVYRATMVPWLWFLTRTADCRIFQNTKIPDIIKQVFEDYGFANFEFRLTATYNPKEYVVQYRETAFAFISRLLEHEGIYYFFTHENGKHTMIMVDSPSKHENVEGYAQVEFVGSERAKIGFERVWEWQLEKRLQPGKAALTDFDFKAPTKNLYAEKADPKQHASADYEVFDYPGQYLEPEHGTTYAAMRNEELAAQHAVAKAVGDTRGLTVGAKFKLNGFPRQDQNAEYVVISSSAEAHVDEFDTGGKGGEESFYQVTFNSIPALVQYRPSRTTTKPRVAGPQTAIIVSAKEGDKEEVYTDEYGRVKVHFHWDRYNKADDKASCWVRVAQVWAGKKWGAMFIPRVGQEVVIDFLEGDPDQPLITGRVYNKDCMPPYALPDHKTVSTIKTSSSKGGEGFNEIRFEDKKGSEQLFVHAEKQLDIRVKADRFENIGNDRHLVVENNRLSHIKANDSLFVDGNRLTEIGGDDNLKVSGKSATEIAGSQSVTVKGKAIHETHADHSLVVSGQLSVKADTIVIEGSTNITLKVGGSSIAIDSSSIDIKTTKLTTKSDGATKFQATAGMDLKAAKVKIKAQTTFNAQAGIMAKMKALAATVQGTGKADLKGAMTKVAGTASTKITGGTISIG